MTISARTRRPPVVVVGAGHAGLAVAAELAGRGIEHVVLERGAVGESWRAQRWDSFALNTPNSMNRLPGDPPLLPTDERADRFDTMAEHVRRLERYAADRKLPVRSGAAVAAVRRHGSSLRVTLEGGEELAASAVVVASGAQNVPVLPSFAASLPDGPARLHVAEYRSARTLPPGAVLVVGSAQSGVQVVEDLLEAGREVFLCTSAVARAPRRYRGRDIFEWLLLAGWWDATPESLPDPRMLTARNPVISGVGGRGHTVSLQALAARGVRLLGRPRGVAGGRLLLDDTVAANVAFGDRTSAEMKAMVDRMIGAGGLDAPPPEADPADRPHPDPMAIVSPSELDLEAAGVGSILFATGFTAHPGFLPAAGLDERGQPRHVGGVSPVDGVFVVGWPWLTKRKSPLILGAAEDAPRIADAVAARVS